MAAANSRSAGGIAASLGKRVVDKIWTRDPPPCLSFLSPVSALTFRRAVHTAVYDKNPEEEVHPTVVPDHVIQPLSEEYWAPHPQTGVFRPPKDHSSAAGVRTADGGGQGSVLEQQAWFRPTGLEDLEKPHHHN